MRSDSYGFYTRGGAGSWLGLDVKRKGRGKKEEYYKKARKKEGGLLLQIRRQACKEKGKVGFYNRFVLNKQICKNKQICIDLQ